jgi:hypothetical protein
VAGEPPKDWNSLTRDIVVDEPLLCQIGNCPTTDRWTYSKILPVGFGIRHIIVEDIRPDALLDCPRAGIPMLYEEKGTKYRRMIFNTGAPSLTHTSSFASAKG